MEGVGVEQLHAYRYDKIRFLSLLSMPFIMASAFTVGMWYLSIREMPFDLSKDFVWACYMLTAAFTVSFIFICRHMLHMISTRVETGESGLRVTSSVKERFIPWHEITSIRRATLSEKPHFRFGPNRDLLVTLTSKDRIAFYRPLINRQDAFAIDELIADIEGHTGLKAEGLLNKRFS